MKPDEFLKPDWAESVVSIPHPTEPGKRVVGFKVDNSAAYPSDWLFKLQNYLAGGAEQALRAAAERVLVCWTIIERTDGVLGADGLRVAIKELTKVCDSYAE